MELTELDGTRDHTTEMVGRICLAVVIGRSVEDRIIVSSFSDTLPSAHQQFCFTVQL